MRSQATRSLTMILTLVLMLGSVVSAFAQTPQATPMSIEPTFREDACVYELPADLVEGEDVVCGWVTAPMYPDGSGTGVVELPIIRVLATTDTPAAEPLVILLGGPGQSMSAVLPLFGDEWPAWQYMLDRQDVILFDQRGMGQSVPSLACPFEQGDNAAPGNGLVIFRCGAELREAGIDPAAFTTEHNAADIEAIRVAMGYDQIDLYGISYGSKLALSAIRDYPDSIRASIIASPLPLENNPLLDQIIGFDAALTTVWDACAADPLCSVDNPDPADAMDRAVKLLMSNPMTITAPDPATGDMISLPIDGYQFMQVVYLSVFVGSLTPSLPALVTSVANGDDSLLQELAPALLTGGGLTMGALFTYFCQDEVAFTSAEQTGDAVSEADLQGPVVDGNWIGVADQLFPICRMWAFPAADPIENEAVVSDEPLLILTGAFDPITPPINGEIVLANFPNGQLVEFAAQGHDPASFVPECSGPMMTAFLNDPTAPVDSECAAVPLEFSSASAGATPVATPIATPEIGN